MPTFIQKNWKGIVVGAAVMAAGAYGGPIAGKVTGYLAPKALQHVSDTPLEDLMARMEDLVAHKNPLSATAIVPAKVRVTLADVARDWGIQGRLSCMVVER